MTSADGVCGSPVAGAAFLSCASRRGRRYPAVAHTGAVGAAPDYPVVLAQGSRRRTRCVRCARSAQTAATSQLTKRAARADPRAVLLGAPEIASAGYRLPRGVDVDLGDEYQIPLMQRRVRLGRSAPLLRREAQGLRPSAQRGSSTLSSRLFERRERSERREFRDVAARPSIAEKSGAAPTAAVKRCGLSARAFAAPKLEIEVPIKCLNAGDIRGSGSLRIGATGPMRPLANLPGSTLFRPVKRWSD